MHINKYSNDLVVHHEGELYLYDISRRVWILVAGPGVFSPPDLPNVYRLLFLDGL